MYFHFFERLEQGTLKVFLPELVLFETFFTLTSFYKVPPTLVAEKLGTLVQFAGIEMNDKQTTGRCLEKLRVEKVDLVDADLLALCERHGIEEIYSFDQDLAKRGLRILIPA